MINEEYFEKLETYIEKLNILRSEGIKIAKDVIGDSLIKDDLLFIASIDRCLHLIDGIVTLLRERNLTCAGALLRLQMDNCMRTYAVFIAKDKDKVEDCLIYGTSITKEKDVNGQQLTDHYLRKAVAKLDSQFSQIYENTCGYIHLSEKAFYQTVTDVDNEGRITFQIGHELPENRNNALLECAETFCRFVKLHYRILADAVKKKHDAKQQHNNVKDE